MEILDMKLLNDGLSLLTIIIALYGAIVSTILGIREINKEKKKIAIFLVYNEWQGGYSITITNIGHRPITLIDLQINIPSMGLVPKNALMFDNLAEEVIEWPMPVTLTDAEHISIRISSNVSKYIEEEKKKIVIVAYDSEGKSYSEYKKLSYDSKYGGLFRK